MEVPSWWLYISGAFFIVNLFVFIGLLVAIFQVVKVVKDISPRVHSLTTKVEGLTEKVGQLTESAKNTVETVGGKARNVAGSAESIANVGAAQFERFAPILAGVLTGLKILGAVRAFRQSGQQQQADDGEDE